MSFLPDSLFKEPIGGQAFGDCYYVYFSTGAIETYGQSGKQYGRIGPPISPEELERHRKRERWTCEYCGEWAGTGAGICRSCVRKEDGEYPSVGSDETSA